MAFNFVLPSSGDFITALGWHNPLFTMCFVIVLLNLCTVRLVVRFSAAFRRHARRRAIRRRAEKAALRKQREKEREVRRQELEAQRIRKERRKRKRDGMRNNGGSSESIITRAANRVSQAARRLSARGSMQGNVPGSAPASTTQLFSEDVASTAPSAALSHNADAVVSATPARSAGKLPLLDAAAPDAAQHAHQASVQQERPRSLFLPPSAPTSVGMTNGGGETSNLSDRLVEYSQRVFVAVVKGGHAVESAGPAGSQATVLHSIDEKETARQGQAGASGENETARQSQAGASGEGFNISHAATQIQAVARGATTRQRVRVEGGTKRSAATVINAHAHGYLARQQIHDMHDSACLIQATFRGHKTRHAYLQSALKASHVQDHRKLGGAAAFFAVVTDAQEATRFQKIRVRSKMVVLSCWQQTRKRHSLLSVAAPTHQKTEEGAWVESTSEMSDGQAVQLFWTMLATGCARCYSHAARRPFSSALASMVLSGCRVGCPVGIAILRVPSLLGPGAPSLWITSYPVCTGYALWRA